MTVVAHDAVYALFEMQDKEVGKKRGDKAERVHYPELLVGVKDVSNGDDLQLVASLGFLFGIEKRN